MPNPTEIDRRFTPARVEGLDMDRFAALNEAYRKFAHMLDEVLPDGREKSCALTELQSSKFWANEANAKR
jgi:hypothetical protein